MASPRLAICSTIGLLCSPEVIGAQERVRTDSVRKEIRDSVVYVYIMPQPKPAKDTVWDSVYLEKVTSSGSNAWYVNQYLRHRFEVRLIEVENEQQCRKRQVRFLAPESGKTGEALPSAAGVTITVAGEWAARGRFGSRCRATVRWRLGDVPGQQTLRAVLVRDTNQVVSPDVAQRDPDALEFRASAHSWPALVAGFSYVVGSNPPPSNPADSTLARRGQPFFGIEFVPLLGNPRVSVARVLERVRITLGTSYRTPGYDLYVGLSPLALIDGLRHTALPVQATLGRRWSARGNDTYFVAATLNASSLFSTVVGKL